MDIDSSPSMEGGVPAPSPMQHQPTPAPLAPPPRTQQPQDFVVPPKLRLHARNFATDSQIITEELPSVTIELPSVASVSPIPVPNGPLRISVGTPRAESLLDSQISTFPEVEAPDEDLGDDFLPRVPKSIIQEVTPYEIEELKTYKATAQEQLITRVSETDTNKTLGFIDKRGYLIELEAIPDDRIGVQTSGKPGSTGEATYFTALAVVALATGNYKPDEWEKQNADAAISRFLVVLEQTSWGKTDFLFEGQTSQGSEHPIRHPDWFEWSEDGRKRTRPMSKDAFGPIVAACYYAYNCPNSSEGVRAQSQRVVKRWVTYLSEHSWTIHTNWARDEFEKPFLNGPDPTTAKANRKLGIEAFLLLPHELYALKLCAQSLSVPHSIISPFLGIGVAIDQAIPIIVKSLRDTLDQQLDLFNYSSSFDVELIPGWRRSAVKGRFSINMLAPGKTQILDGFEAACNLAFSKNAHIFRDPHALSLGLDTIIMEVLDGIQGLLPEALKLFPFGSVILDIFKQLLPWFDTELLSEYMAFMTFFLPTTTASDSDVGYIVWSFIVLLETRPSLVPWMRPAILSIFASAANRGNPNGTWAWLADEKSSVNAQIKRFENAHINNWKYYAYTKNYEDWLKNDVNERPDVHGPASSRLDYLILQGLAKKGTPPPLPNIKVNLKLLWDGFEKCIQGLKDEILQLFKTLGKWERQFVDRAGALVHETIDQVQGFTRNIWKAGIQTSRFIHSLAQGFIEYTAWTIGGLAHHMKWAKALPDLSLNPHDLIHFRIRNVFDSTMKVWNWANGALVDFVNYAKTSINGAIEDLKDYTAMQIRALGGELKQWVREAGALVSYMVWSNSSISGIGNVEKLILRNLRLPAGQMYQWAFEPDKGLKSFTHWLDSRVDLSADADKVGMQLNRAINGSLSVVLKDGPRLISRTLFSNSTLDAVAEPVDCLLYQFRAIDSVIEEWDVELGVPMKYRKWVRSTLKGVGTGKDMVKSIERLADGRFVSKNFQDGVEKGGQILDKWGNELEKIGKGAGNAVQDVGDSIGRLFPGWHI